MQDHLDLAAALEAGTLPALAITMPRTGADVEVARFLRRDARHPDPIERCGNCWAPNKPSIDFEGSQTWAEFVIVRLLERNGWDARWIKNWAGGREFCVDVDRPEPLPVAARSTFDRIDDAAAALHGGGAWDVFAWRGDAYRFIESKQHRSGDRLNKNQIAWLEAALGQGVPASWFAVVEYDAGPPTRRPVTRVALKPDASHGIGEVPEGLEKLLQRVRAIDRTERIELRDRVAAFGGVAIGPVAEWLKDGALRRFAITVLEVIGRTDPDAIVPLHVVADDGGPDAELAAAAIDRLAGPSHASAPRARTAWAEDEFIATGPPPPAQGSCDVLNRDGTMCTNPGRWPVQVGWSCTTHYKALVRRGQT